MYIFQRIFLLRTACFSFPFNLSCLEREKYFKIENKSIKKMTLYLFLFLKKIFSFEIKASVVKWKYLLYFLTHSSVSEMESRIQWGGGGWWEFAESGRYHFWSVVKEYSDTLHLMCTYLPTHQNHRKL